MTNTYLSLQIIQDFCHVLEDGRTEFISVKGLPKQFVLELLESILADNAQLFIHHPEQGQVLQARLMPIVIRFLAEPNGFALTVRASRVLLLLLRDYMSIFPEDCQKALDLLIHQLDQDATAWKRVLSMEIFRSLYSEPKIIRQIFYFFDEQEGRRHIMRDHMACLVRLASEKPNVIGIGHQSTLPTGPVSTRDVMDEAVTLETGVAGVIGSGTGQLSACGVSTQFSLVRSPFLDVLDKQDPPPLPETYIYSLVLNCIGAFAESIAKFILPLTVPDMKNKRRLKEKPAEDEAGRTREAQRSFERSRVPLNPLDLESHPQIGEINSCAKMIDDCWPALLAACSTFLYAALDNDFYHNLVRSFQKIAHVAGLLRLVTPRDAFLTTLGKAAVPADIFGSSSGSRGASNTEPLKSPNVVDPSISSSEAPPVTFNIRNLLCLRALLNLGIALGPTLSQDAWFIIIETLWYADLVVGISTKSTAKLSDRKSIDVERASAAEVSKGTLGNEILAVQTAATKMFESTTDYPDLAFKNIPLALLGLSSHAGQSFLLGSDDSSAEMPQPSLQLSPGAESYQNKRSMSIAVRRPRAQEGELKFVLEKVADLSTANSSRLSRSQDKENIWAILSTPLIAITSNEDISPSLRLEAGNILNSIVFNSIKLGSSSDDSTRSQTQLRGLGVLKRQVCGLYARQSQTQLASSRSATFEVHGVCLETLRSILEECGGSLIAGWEIVFELILSVFLEDMGEQQRQGSLQNDGIQQPQRKLLARSPKLIRTAHKSLQLLSSDFLASLPSNCLLDLIIAFYNFAAQEEDFNISLTSTTAFWTISDFLRSQIDNFSIENYIDESSDEETLIALAKNTDIGTSRNALWMVLLTRMVDLSRDPRSEIRNSVVQTVTRIVDAYGQRMSSKAWMICLNKVLFAVAEAIQMQVLAVIRGGHDAETRRTAVETAVLEIKGLSNIIATYFEVIVLDSDFAHSWKRLLEFFNSMLKLNILELSEAVFSSFKDLLSQIKNPKHVPRDLLQLAWSCWADGSPVSSDIEADLDLPNQEALLAYLTSFQEVYRLLKDDMTEEQIDQVLKNFRTAILGSIMSRYSSDVDRLTDVQKAVLEYLATFCLDRPSSQRALVHCYSELVDCALMDFVAVQDKRRPTFVAFSKAVADSLARYIRNQGIVVDLLIDNTLAHALGHLVNLINSKYTFPGTDKEPTLSKVATSSSLEILRVSLPWVESKYGIASEPSITQFWKIVVEIARAIVSADLTRMPLPPRATILADEAFDITSFNNLKGLIIPSLGSTSVNDDIRRTFTFALLQASFVYPPQFGEFSETRAEQPLHDLLRVRMGRTYDPTPNLRVKLAYVLLDTLFELSSEPSQKDSSELYVHLAGTSLPYLVLRTATSLKSYIADQPLRGLMPPPALAHSELLYILSRLASLNSEPSVVSDLGATSVITTKPEPQHKKKHLVWLYPLILQAIQIAGRDENDRGVLSHLMKLTNVLHQESEIAAPVPEMWRTDYIQNESQLG